MTITRIKVKGFNPNFEDPGNPGMERMLLQEPWFSLHRGGLESILSKEISRLAKVISVEVVCEPKTTIKRMKEKLGPRWKTEEWLRMFNKQDVNSDGTLDKAELREMMQAFQCSVQDHFMTDEEFRILWSFLDKDGEGSVDFWELLQAMNFDDLDEERSKRRDQGLPSPSEMKKKRRVASALKRNQPLAESPGADGAGVHPRSHSRSLRAMRQNKAMTGTFRASGVLASHPPPSARMVHAVVSLASEAAAAAVQHCLHRRPVVLHDDVGNALPSTECTARGIVPLNKPFVTSSLPPAVTSHAGHAPARETEHNMNPVWMIEVLPAKRAEGNLVQESVVTEWDHHLVNERERTRNAVDYNRRIGNLPTGSWRQAEEVLLEMQSKGIQPTGHTWTLMLKAYALAKPSQPRRLELMLAKMRREAVTVTEDHESLRVQGWCNAGSLPAAETAVREMERRGPPPSERTYRILRDGRERNQVVVQGTQQVRASKARASRLLGRKRVAALHKQLLETVGNATDNIHKLQELFQSLAGESGVLDERKLVRALQIIGISDIRLVQRYLAEVDETGDGYVDFGEFIHGLKMIIARLEERLRQGGQEPAGGSDDDTGSVGGAEGEEEAEPKVAKWARNRSGWTSLFFWRFDGITKNNF